jgi:hypothetical protein
MEILRVDKVQLAPMTDFEKTGGAARSVRVGLGSGDSIVAGIDYSRGARCGLPPHSGGTISIPPTMLAADAQTIIIPQRRARH